MRTLLFFLAWLVVPAVASAQLTNPTTVEFQASADHNAIQNTVPMLSSYEVRLFTTTTPTTPVKVADIGKPAPDATNAIRWTLLPTLYSTLPAGSYVVKIAAVGPGGSSETSPSDPFSVAPRPPAAPISKPVIK